MKPSFVGLVDYVVNVFLPGEVLTDSDTQVLAAVYYLQYMAMNMVVGLQDLFLVGAESDDTLSGWNFICHAGFFPSLKR